MTCRVPGSRISVNGDCCSLSLAQGKRKPKSSIVSPAALVYTVCILERGERTMRIVVMGAGGVGGYFGALLSRAGHEVAFVARGRHLAAMRERGLLVRSAGREIRIDKPEATDDPSSLGQREVVLFTVKLWDTEAAAQAIRPLLGESSVVIPFQNGVESIER